ncbi:hypothetical protein L596_007851 [Steinernema carpocapsae]|uniref:Uncharacterized protein n=1 Tax=Steinernema carpocapsae TaxID=34508 RepID=A0A4U5PB78_STECR|nr:hypothetical protein L596_007851 [Steinernema carpocapsae]
MQNNPRRAADSDGCVTGSRGAACARLGEGGGREREEELLKFVRAHWDVRRSAVDRIRHRDAAPYPANTAEKAQPRRGQDDVPVAAPGLQRLRLRPEHEVSS